jgi:hypothetical protein
MATRTSSSNFDPVPFWLAGVQMVALNYQSMDLPVLINEGLFRNENGGAGYILKPDLPPPPENQAGCKLSVGVLCGQYLPKPAVTPLGGVTNPMVRVSICGIDKDRKTCVTKQVLENGFNPRWEETCSFELSQPTLALLVFEVVHSEVQSQSVFGCLGRRTSSLRRRPRSAPMGKRGGRGRRLDWTSIGRRGRSADHNRICADHCSSKQFPWSRGAEEVVAAAALPVAGLREGLRWVQLLDARFHPVERSGLLLNIRLSGAWASERRSVSTASTKASPLASPLESPAGHDRAPPAASSSARQRRCISLCASPFPQKENIVSSPTALEGPVALAQDMIVAV